MHSLVGNIDQLYDTLYLLCLLLIPIVFTKLFKSIILMIIYIRKSQLFYYVSKYEILLIKIISNSDFFNTYIQILSSGLQRLYIFCINEFTVT